jgi:hypothetical protein
VAGGFGRTPCAVGLRRNRLRSTREPSKIFAPAVDGYAEPEISERVQMLAARAMPP